MGWGKRIVGIGKAVAGAAMTATGNPAAGVPMMASGGSDIATSFDKQAGTSVPASVRQIDSQPKLPMSASSLDESRTQNKTRMRNIYEWP